MGKLILVRHGETAKNIAHSIHRSNDTAGLTATGRQQMVATAFSLKQLFPSKIISSTEKRAIESATVLAKYLQVPFEKMEGIQERNWGIFTGKPWAEVQQKLETMTIDERYRYVPQDGESWNAFETRLKRAIQKITAENANETTIVVTHGGVIRALLPFLLGVSKEESFAYDPANASLTIFEFDKDRYTKVVINETAHL